MEGPSLVILKEELEQFRGKKVTQVTGNTKLPKEILKGRTLSAIHTWGKVLLLTFTSPRKKPVTTKTHFLMFGSYRINDPKENRVPRLELKFKNGIIYFYACSLQFNGDEFWEKADKKVDLLSPDWERKHVLKIMESKKASYLCDLFLDQTVFAGSGNIVKNEVLFNLRRHPLTKLSIISKKEWPKIAQAVREYCFNFYTWKKNFELRQHWQVYQNSKCPLCQEKLSRENLGKWKRRTFFCKRHQPLKPSVKTLLVFPVLPVKEKIIGEVRLDH